MKIYIIILSLLVIGNILENKSFAMSSSVEVEKLLRTIGIEKFVNSLKKIKKYNSIEEIDELDYELKWYYENLRLWYYFDEEGFRDGLAYKIKNNFNSKELSLILTTFKSPFNLKVINSLVLKRDIFKFHHDSIITDYDPVKLPESRMKVLKNIYLLTGMVIQKEKMELRQEDFVKSGRTILSIIDKKEGTRVFINPSKLKKRFENSEEYFLTYLGSELSSYRHYELREFMRKMKKSVTLQKFIQIYVNYHFLYLTKYMFKVEQDKLDAVKVLKNEKPN